MKLFNAIILSEGSTATTDYFLFPHLESLGYEVLLFDIRRPPLPSESALKSSELFVISRYISNAWLILLKQLTKKQNIKIIYFMDDDLFDIEALRGLTPYHQWKIFTKAWIFRKQLMQLCDEFWVSTPYLAAKYSQYHPLVIWALASKKTVVRKTAIHVCYHGTPSHRKEIAWLIDVVEQVQSRSDNIHFEFFGSVEDRDMLRHLPRTSVVHLMNWDNYLAFSATQTRDIALAPLLENRFNAARAPTKFYDYARLQAVGLYSNVPPYQDFIQHQRDGFLLENDPAQWVEKILQLSANPGLRLQMLENIQQRLLADLD